MMKCFKFLIIVTTLLTGSAISVLAQKNVKTLQHPIKVTNRSTNIRNKANLHTFEAESAKLIAGASKVSDSEASGGSLVSLSKHGQGIKFTNLPVGRKLAICYASMAVGTISVAVDDQPARKVNIHSSGALTGSFLHSIIDIAVSGHSTLTISLADNDVSVNIDKIIIGNNDLGLPPDIWNLPPLPVAAGSYPTDWKGLSRIYTVPEWWREAKFGAWAHWDPQSMPEQGDWYEIGRAHV